VPDEDLEWAVWIAMESRRRVKEQQKRVGAAEYRNTHFSYVIGADGVEKFVSTPEPQSENSIGSDPLEPGQVWIISPGGNEEHPGLYRIEVNEGPGSGVKILNKPVPPAFRKIWNMLSKTCIVGLCSLAVIKIPGITSSRFNFGPLMQQRVEQRSVLQD
jgi:ATP-dependent Lon protease